MSFPMESVFYSGLNGPRRPMPPGKDELEIKPGRKSVLSNGLRVIEWHHMNLALFYPAALTSTWTVRTALYPLTVLRSRLQLQKKNNIYRGTLHAFLDISKQEGIAGLYRGFWVTLPQIGCSFIYSTVYEKLRAILQTDLGMTSAALNSSISGGCASFASQIIFVPTDIIAQYMMVYYHAEKFVAGNDRSVIEQLKKEEIIYGKKRLGLRVLRAIYRADGFSGFYRGFWASSLIYVPYCLVFWPSYYWLQDLLTKLHPSDRRALLFDQGVAATLGGICATLSTNPFEMFRIRLQVHRTNYSETLKRMIRDEKWRVFAKGLPPRLINNAIMSGTVTVGYEVVKRLCVLPEYRNEVVW